MKETCFGESVQGASHKKTGKECQDYYKKTVEKEYTILAVADGHGSNACPYSRTGAIAAVNIFHDVMGTYLEEYAGRLEQLATVLHREGEISFAKNIERSWKNRIKDIQVENSENRKKTPRNSSGAIDWAAVYKMYGCTLLGLVITKDFVFSYQMGDGDIMKVDEEVCPVVSGEHILGVETHSLSRKNAWEKAITDIKRNDIEEHLPRLYLLSTDGFSNSYANTKEFYKTCKDYYETFKEYGADAVRDNLKKWLSETSELGCGDDITLLVAYFE